MHLLITLVATNLATLILLAFAIRANHAAPTGKYNIVEYWGGAILEGPLNLRQARRSQKRWHRLFVWSDGPRTKVVPMTSTRRIATAKDGKKEAGLTER